MHSSQLISNDFISNVPFYNSLSTFTAVKVPILHAKYLLNGDCQQMPHLDEPMKRHEIASVVAHIFSLKLRVPFQRFLDVDADHPNYAAIHLLQMAGIFQSANSLFCPDEYFTRAQTAHILATVAQISPSNYTSFPDVLKQSKEAPLIAALEQLHVVEAIYKDKFFPHAPITRRHFLQWLDNLLLVITTKEVNNLTSFYI